MKGGEIERRKVKERERERGREGGVEFLINLLSSLPFRVFSPKGLLFMSLFFFLLFFLLHYFLIFLLLNQTKQKPQPGPISPLPLLSPPKILLNLQKMEEKFSIKKRKRQREEMVMKKEKWQRGENEGSKQWEIMTFFVMFLGGVLGF